MSRPKVTFEWKVVFSKTREGDEMLSPELVKAFEDEMTRHAIDFAKGRGIEPMTTSLKARYTAGRGVPR